ncbi:MAG: hypothetical protein IPK82_41540 [Polyangiaceae bacterium]|nr:hypothetical protein [Polyangiaceae bacterium]
MKGRKFWCALAALGIGFATAGASTDAFAQKKPKDKPAAPAPNEPATSKKDLNFDLAGVSWGQSIKAVTEAVGKILDEDYKPLYAKVSPGVKMQQLDAALAEEKSAFARSKIDFGKTPVALDSGPLKGEYTYNNKEAKLEFSRKGVTFHFFFIQDKLWKIIAEKKLGEKEAAGKDFADAVAKVAKDLGVAGRIQAADAAKGLYAQEVDWKDAKTHLRVIERSAATVAFAYEDQATLANLTTLRANKPPATNEVDPAVAAVTRKETPPPEPPKPDPKKAPKK